MVQSFAVVDLVVGIAAFLVFIHVLKFEFNLRQFLSGVAGFVIVAIIRILIGEAAPFLERFNLPFNIQLSLPFILESVIGPCLQVLALYILVGHVKFTSLKDNIFNLAAGILFPTLILGAWSSIQIKSWAITPELLNYVLLNSSLRIFALILSAFIVIHVVLSRVTNNFSHIIFAILGFSVGTVTKFLLIDDKGDAWNLYAANVIRILLIFILVSALIIKMDYCNDRTKVVGEK